jgi:alpha-L-fucosidase 2
LRRASTKRWRNWTRVCTSASGASCEWKVDLDDPKDDHRHVSHLFALHPGRAIDPDKPVSEPRRRARRSTPAATSARLEPVPRKINFWARLRDGDRAQVVSRSAQ